MAITKRCWQKYGCRCAVHDRPCQIALEFDDGRAISIAAAERVPEVAKYLKHGPDSVHTCDWCSVERQENREPGYYQAHPESGKMVPRAIVEKFHRDAKREEERKAKRKKKRWGRKRRDDTEEE